MTVVKVALFWFALFSSIPRAYRSGTLKQHSFYEAMLPFISPLMLFGICMLWVCTSQYDVIEKHPRIIYFLVGTAFSNITVSPLLTDYLWNFSVYIAPYLYRLVTVWGSSIMQILFSTANLSITFLALALTWTIHSLHLVISSLRSVSSLAMSLNLEILTIQHPFLSPKDNIDSSHILSFKLTFTQMSWMTSYKLLP